MDLLSMIADERRRVAELVESLKPSELIAQSLCAEWTVHEVAAHLVTPFGIGSRRLLPILARTRFKPHRASALLARELAAERSADELALDLREHAQNPYAPPGAGLFGQLVDVQVHGQDIRRPLGLEHGLRPERIRPALEFLASPRARGAFVPKGLFDGLRFVATDTAWEAGQGLSVRGPGEALMLALTGRPIPLDELDGGGVATLRARITP
ncbi:maleylpyruvate isomerase family mycothiol-dependent enzyme [Actinoplanes sp. NPDC051851]|uniref:maleylpyruvate isomerase family mycothiol-dependent enzyme n=1 Tax=Actinoplanes sp. NPDC051851 TaxID=3154753 RepID=UPI0034269E26